MADNVIASAEVAKHSTKKDCWVIIAGNVYNVTKFLDDHPGGPETILEHAGKDCTTNFEDTGHSKSAREQMTKYLVGTLPEEERAASASAAAGKSRGGGGSGTGSAASSSPLTWLIYAIPALVVAAAVLYQFGVFGGVPAAGKGK